MANSSIGPGFLTQTTFFTEKLMTSFGFVILVSVLIDIGAQLNTWRIMDASEMRAQDLSNQLLRVSDIFICIGSIGSFAFNIGNIAGCGLGVNVLTAFHFSKALSSWRCSIDFILDKEISKMLDGFTKVLGTIKILLTLFIAFRPIRHCWKPFTIPLSRKI